MAIEIKTAETEQKIAKAKEYLSHARSVRQIKSSLWELLFDDDVYHLLVRHLFVVFRLKVGIYVKSSYSSFIYTAIVSTLCLFLTNRMITWPELWHPEQLSYIATLQKSPPRLSPTIVITNSKVIKFSSTSPVCFELSGFMESDIDFEPRNSSAQNFASQ